MADDVLKIFAEGQVDARSLSEFVFKPAGFKVTRRLAPPIDTLQFYIDKFDSLDSVFAASVATAQTTLSSAIATANQKLGTMDNTLQAAIDKVDYIEFTVQDAINNTAVVGGILADTFVTMTKQYPDAVARTLRDVNNDTLSVKDFDVKGDGTDETAKINKAATAAAGRTLYFPEGLYVASNISTTANFDFLLDNNATIKLKDNSTASALFNMGAVIKGKVTGGTIDSNKDNQTTRIHTFVGAVPEGSSLEIEHTHLTNIRNHGTYITNFGGYLGFNYNVVTKQAEHPGTPGDSTCIVSVMEGQLGKRGLLRFNHNRAYFRTVPREDGSNPGGVFFAPTLEYATGTGNFSTFEAIGNYFYGYGQHISVNDISPLHTYPSSTGARFINNYFEQCGFCAISAKSVQDFICVGNYVVNGMTSTKNSASEGAISYAPGYHAGSVQRPRAIIANNIITSPGGEPNKKQTGIAIQSVPASKADNVIIANNIMTDCGTGITGNQVINAKVFGNTIDGATTGITGTDMGIRFDNVSGLIELSGNTINSKNGHGVYCMNSINAKFILSGNTINHSGSSNYAVLFRGVDTVKMTGNMIDATAGFAINIAAYGTDKVKHFIYDNTNTVLKGDSAIKWNEIEKVSGDLIGTVLPTTIVPSAKGVRYTNASTGQNYISTGVTSSDWQQVQIGTSTAAGTTPTVTAGSDAAGAGATASVKGTDLEGQFTVSTGASPNPEGGGMLTFKFQSPLSAAPKGVLITPANGNALVKNDLVVVYSSTLTTTGFSVSVVGGTLNASVDYIFYYKVLV